MKGSLFWVHVCVGVGVCARITFIPTSRTGGQGDAVGVCERGVFLPVDLCGRLRVYTSVRAVYVPAGSTHSASLLPGPGARGYSRFVSVMLPDSATPNSEVP